MLHTKRLTTSEMKEIYDNHMQEAFPPSELRPWFNIKMLLAKDNYIGFGLYDDEVLQAYAFFSKADMRPYALLDYYAVLAGKRGGGIGSRFFELLRRELTSLDGVLLEVESVESAETDDERTLRTRRIAFYERNGCVMTGVKCLLYGVDYRILCLPIAKPAPADSTAFDELTTIYRTMFPPTLFERICHPFIENIKESR